jgi:Mycobacterium membrane protein
MNRPYTAHSPYSLTPTEVIDTSSVEDLGEFDYDALHEYPDDGEYAEYAEYDEARIDRRWMWIAGMAGAILFVAIGTTGIILGGGDSGSVSATATSGAPTTSAAPVTSSAPPAAATPAPVVPALPRETVTTVSPTAETTPAQPEAAAPPPPTLSPRTITYRVTGNRQLIDLITVIYTDRQGALQTDVNVALPWSKTVVLDPGVELKSVTATSVGGQLNCSITDAAGAVVAAQANNSMIATCTQ